MKYEVGMRGRFKDVKGLEGTLIEVLAVGEDWLVVKTLECRGASPSGVEYNVYDVHKYEFEKKE